MRRANTFAVRPLSDRDERLLRDLLDASAALWNETNYERLLHYNDEGGYVDEGVFEANTDRLEGKYKGVLGASTAQQVIRKNAEAWRSFFALKKRYLDTENPIITNHPNPPGFRGNRDEGRNLMGVIRNDAYTIEWGNRSRLELLVGSDLNEKYDHTGRLRLEICGEPIWLNYEKQGRLELWLDEVVCTFRASQSFAVSHGRQSPLASNEAALDIGANNLAACSTSAGQQYLYKGRELFDRFRETTKEIARLQSKLSEGRYSSRRIRRLYRKRTRRRDHAQDALVRDLMEPLYFDGVASVYVGDLTDVLSEHWSAAVNEKTHQFWAYRSFINRLATAAEEYGINVEVRPEAYTTAECPECGEHERTTRTGDAFHCPCGFEGHADLKAAQVFLERQTDTTVRPMARPVRFEWDDHTWSESPNSHESPNEQLTNRSTANSGGNIALGDF